MPKNRRDEESEAEEEKDTGFDSLDELEDGGMCTMQAEHT